MTMRDTRPPDAGRRTRVGHDLTRVPRLPRTFVQRTQLDQHLDRCAHTGVTVIVAPVGAGKTLGVSGWLTDRELDSEARWISGRSHWTPSELARVLDHARPRGDKAPAPVVVVDDAHELPPATLRMIDTRLAEDPEALRLVLLSRWDLPLVRLIPELLGHLTVLRGDVLRLAAAEAEALARAHSRTEDAEITAAVTEHAQGWCAAVVLAARAVASAPDPRAAALAFSHGDLSVADRLASEVFAGLQPRERHTLLCVSGEREVGVETAAHLSHDIRAGDVLTGLEATGLLVTRVPSEAANTLATGAGEEPGAVYRVHPLLLEACRRRVAAGGVDVLQAQATVRRAVGLDLARGDSHGAFGRLVALNLHDEAARLLAEQGLLLLVRDRGRTPRPSTFARHHPEAVADLPAAWLVLGAEHWLADEQPEAVYWFERISDHGGDGSSLDEVRLAGARLLLARLGTVALPVAIAEGEHALAHHVTAATPRILKVLLHLGLGGCHNLTGDLAAAEAHLTEAATLGRSMLLPGITALALSYLALTAYMRGREHTAAELAEQVLELLGSTPDGSRIDVTRSRADLVHELATMCDLPGLDGVHATTGWSGASYGVDTLTHFWAWLRDARVALAQGSVAAAEQHLELPRWGTTLSPHLRVIALVERAFLASLAGDSRTLRTIEDDLLQLGVSGEAALVRGLRHELEGDRRAARAAYLTAVEDPTYDQPPTRALALVCRAQVLDALGHPDVAMAHLAEAATLTEVRRNAAPFLGWSRQGTPVAGLLRRLVAVRPTPWTHELAESAAQRPDIAALFAPSVASSGERSRSEVGLPAVPALSPREREVLHELARGATYADIAARLYVSENTVKTHVSNLYSKLVVTRRSDALAVARSLHLI